MKRIYGFMIVMICVCLFKEQAFAQESDELLLFNYENESKEDEITDIESMLKCVYGGEYDELDICEYLSFYSNDNDEVIYMYPIYDGDECILLALSDGNGNVTLSEDTRMYDGIISTECTGEYLSYMDNGNLYIKAQDKCIEVFGTTDVSGSGEEGYLDDSDMVGTKDFKTELYATSENDVIKSVSLEADNKYGVVTTTKSTGSGGLSKVTKKCNITNFVSQGNYNLCWASAVATIVNYKNGTGIFGINATRVADRMGIGYNTGATLAQTRSALALYGLSYTTSNSKMPWWRVKSNIMSDKPFIIGLTSSYGNHIITGYGYSCDLADSKAYTRAICAWDSNGFKITFLYNANKVVTSGISFNWSTSIY